jgi:hypothetical protein
MTIERLTLALVVAAAAVPQSAAKCLGTSAVGWRPQPILISFSFRLVRDQSLIGSGVASVRKKLPRL